MDIIWKIFLTIIFGVFLLSGCTSIITGNAQSVEANNYFEEVSKVIAESNYSQEVIDSCEAEAASNGYELEVIVESSARPGGPKCAKLIFKYDYEMKLFGFSQQKVKQKTI